MDIEQILSKFKNPKPTGTNRWRAICPAHPDRHPSLDITLSSDGKILLHCWTGCEVEDIIGAVGLTMADLFLNNGTPAHSTAKHKQSYQTIEQITEAIAGQTGGQLAGTWNYNDNFSVLRFDLKDGKTYRPVHRTSGGWKQGDPPGQTLPLYGLSGVNGQQRIYIVEGEKCCEIAQQIGLPTITSPHGANSPHKANWDVLRDREAIILPDNDEAGMKYAESVGKILFGLGCQVKIVSIPEIENVPGGDIADFVELRESTEDSDLKIYIEQLASKAEFWQPEPVEAKTETGQPQRQAVLVNFEDMEVEKIEWLWEQRIPLGMLSLVTGDPDLGKSTVTLDIASRISRGGVWPDNPEYRARKGNVVMMSTEDDPTKIILPRLIAANADISKVTYLKCVETREDDMLREKGFDLQVDIDVLEDAMKQLGDVRLVIFDPISAYLGKIDSHKNAEIRGVIEPLSRLAMKYNVAIIGITHLNKNQAGAAIYRNLGSIGLTAAARSSWIVVKDKSNPEYRQFLPQKKNLSKNNTGLRYRLETSEDNPDVAVIAWERDPITVDIDEALAPERHPRESEALDEAVEFLKYILQDGPREVKDIRKRATNEGLSWATIRRAQKKLDIRPQRKGFGPEGKSLWKL